MSIYPLDIGYCSGVILSVTLCLLAISIHSLYIGSTWVVHLCVEYGGYFQCHYIRWISTYPLDIGPIYFAHVEIS